MCEGGIYTKNWPTMEEKIKMEEQRIRDAIKSYGAHTNQHTVIEDVCEDFYVRLAKDSVSAKQSLRDLFRKSPVWNEELDALVINGNRTHTTNYERVRSLFWQIFDPMWNNTNDQKLRDNLENAAHFFAHPEASKDMPADYIASIKALAPKAYAPGKKPSRIFKALCQALGVADETAGSRFQHIYAQFADELTSRQIDFKLYVGLSPAYFVTMSNPKGDERGKMLVSCHSFNSTQHTYNAGCTGYARDGSTFIVFTVDDDKNPESFFNRKTSRQIFAYRPGSGLLLQSRMYNTEGGVYGAAENADLYRDLVQRELSALEKKPNLWKKHDAWMEDDKGFIQTGEGFGGYPDWHYDDFECYICFRADCNPDTVEPLVIGTWPLCVECGEENRTLEGMYCADCFYDYKCERCGCGCERVYLVYTPAGTTINVCHVCRSNFCVRCEECGRWVERGEAQEIDGTYYCHDCTNNAEIFVPCHDCGSIHHRRNMFTVHRDTGGSTYQVCSSCAIHDDYGLCHICRTLHPRTDLQPRENDSLGMCSNCRSNVRLSNEAPY